MIAAFANIFKIPELRARVLELRRTHSAADVARQTGLPVGTVKAICSRAGTTRDNSAARAFFALPPLALANTTAVTAPTPLPVQRNSTHQNATTPARPLSRVFALWSGIQDAGIHAGIHENGQLPDG